MNKILFIGSFLSKSQGTHGISEKLSKTLISNGLCVRLSSKKKNKFLRFFEIVVVTLFSRYKKIHIDVFSGPAFKIAEIASFLAQYRSKHIILTLRGGKLPEFSRDNRERIIKVFERASLITTPSLYLANFFEDLGLNIAYLPNSIKTDKFPFREDQVLNNKILWVRAFDSIYCPQVAIEALKMIKKEFPNATLTMIGPDKGKLASIINLINKYHLTDSVDILGPIANYDLKKYYNSHQVFFNTTAYESFGNCILEAASCGTSIITNTVGEIPYLWKHEVNALLVKNNDPELFANYTIRLFRNPNVSERLRSAARKRSKEFEEKLIISKWLEIFND